ncbi:MAG TPA: hypothetical protein EYG11_23760 [Candidatus Latescibacteria bacterium]|nr:hypothetical protein [Candidatus Latescibacterota bacterium]
MALRIARHRLQPELQIEIRTDSHTNQVVEEYQYYVDSESGERVRHGYCRAFYPDGSPMESSQYDHGKTEGEWEYRQSGIGRIGAFEEGRLVGVYSDYDGNGRKIRAGT